MFRPTRPGASLSRRGAVLPLVAILMVVLLAMMAFAIDIGYIVLARTELQAAADSSVLAAASQLQSGVPAVQQATSLQKAKEFAAYNRGGSQSVVLADSDVEFGTWDSVTRTFQVGQPTLFPTAVRVRAHRDSSNQRGPLPLFFARVLGTKSANVEAEAVAGQMAVNAVDGVPIALRSNQSFGPVDPKIATQNPGKDGPSYPTHPNPSDPNAFFSIGDEVVVAVFGKGSQSSSDLVLDMPGVDVAKVLEGGALPTTATVKLDDQFPLVGQGSDGGAGLLEKRIQNASGPSDPRLTVILPVVANVPGNRQSDGRINGNVKVVEFVAIQLGGTREVLVPNPDSSGSFITNKIVFGTIVKKAVRSKSTTRNPSTILPDPSAFTLQLVR